MPNRLAREKSPYLLQHAANPVDWYPWGEEAFERARSRDLPIFLSIGYSTCHWCHVMAHESFERPDVAEVLNREFVPVKVDREERPDVDRVYMAFVQATTGSGGWPMSVWLTPGLKPFYGGTYFPPESRWNRPGFLDLLREIGRAWRDRRADILASADQLLGQLRDAHDGPAGGRVPGERALTAGVRTFAQAFDARRGGFGQAPKFPRPAELLFLLREAHRTGDADARRMAEATLQAMALGGMRDHVGGGFHRYAVDAAWRIPHFEKMLYDQAQLALAYLEAFQLTGEAGYADVAEDTLAYVARDLSHPDGGFYSAEDADSVPVPGAVDDGAPAAPARASEGAFYLWTRPAVCGLLGPEGDLVCARFGVQAEGNAPADPHGEFGRGNQFFVARDLEGLAAEFGGTAMDIAARLDDARQVLLEARDGRPRPHLDDKVLTAWNGLMLGAFARAARVLGLEEHLATAVRIAAFVRQHLWDDTRGVLRRRFRDGESAGDGYADDYANLVFGLLELFQAGGDPQWLEWALRLQRRMDELFWDEAAGGWFSTTGTDASVLLRLKEDYDGAEPSASAVAAGNLLVLAHLTGNAAWTARLERVLEAFAPRLEATGRAMPQLLAVLSAYQAGILQVVVVGAPDDARTRALWDAAARVYLPFAVCVAVSPGDAQARLAKIVPVIGDMGEAGGTPAAYVCRDFVCQRPVTEAQALMGLLAPA